MSIGRLGSTKVFRDPSVPTLKRYKSDVQVPAALRPYKYKTSRKASIEGNYLSDITRDATEALTGYVRGSSASKLEERFAIALDEAGLEFIFQYRVDSAYDLPDEGKTIDFIVFDGGTPFPVEIGSAFVHKAQEEQDRARDQRLNEILAPFGYQPIIRLEYDHPESIDDARKIVKEMFIG